MMDGAAYWWIKMINRNSFWWMSLLLCSPLLRNERCSVMLVPQIRQRTQGDTEGHSATPVLHGES
jgi:hypothetical protein